MGETGSVYAGQSDLQTPSREPTSPSSHSGEQHSNKGLEGEQHDQTHIQQIDN